MPEEQSADMRPGVALLEDLQVHEVSLVDRAANGRSFLVWKRAEGKENVKDTIQAVADTATEKEAGLIEAIAKHEMSEEAREAVVTAHRLLEGFAEEIPAEALVAAGLGAEVAVEEPTIEEEAVEAAADPEAEEVVEPGADTEPVLKAARDRIAELETILKAERDERILKADTDRAVADFGRIPGIQASELGPVLGELRKAAPESLKVIETTLARIAKAYEAEAGGLLAETGKTTAVVSTGSALERIDQLVEERIAKGLNNDRPSAFADVTRLHSNLYGEYVAERSNK